MSEHEVSQRIRSALLANGRTVSSLASKLKITKQAMNSMLQSKWSRPTRLQEIADFAGVSINWLRLGMISDAPAWALKNSPVIAQEINHALAAENARLRAENLTLHAHLRQAGLDESPVDGQTAFAGQIALTTGERLADQAEADASPSPPVPPPRRKRRRA